MAYPPLADLDTSFTAFQQGQGDNSFPGQQLDADLVAVRDAVNNLNAWVRKFTRADGRLANRLVTLESLAPDVLMSTSAPQPWVAGVSYSPGETIFREGIFYVCMVTHIASDFPADLALGRWDVVVDFAAALGASDAAMDAAASAIAAAGVAAGVQVAVEAIQEDIEGYVAPSGPVPPASPSDGMLWYDGEVVQVYDSDTSTWSPAVTAAIGGLTINRGTFGAAPDGQITIAPGAQEILVFKNGVLLEVTTSYTFVDPLVTILSPAQNDDWVVWAYRALDATDYYTQSEVDDRTTTFENAAALEAFDFHSNQPAYVIVGGFRYHNVAASEPSHLAKLQSADDVWWENAEPFSSPAMFGYSGSNGYAVLVSMCAVGKPLRIESAFAVNLLASQQITFPAGRHTLHGVTFNVTQAYGSSTPALLFTANAEFDLLRVRVPAGVTSVDRFLALGADNVKIDMIDVEAVDTVGMGDDTLDGFIRILSDYVSVGRIRTKNIDRPLQVYQANHIVLDDVQIEKYLLGTILRQSSEIRIGRFRAFGISDNSAPTAGNNGLRIDDCTHVSVTSCDIEDSPEHGVYVAGGDGVGVSSEDIWFGSVRTRRTGRSGFKCKQAVTPAHNVTVDNLHVIDAANDSTPGPNEDALRVEFTEHFTCGCLTVDAIERPNSCFYGVFLDGVKSFKLNGGVINRCSGSVFRVQDARGDVSLAQISNVSVFDCDSHGLDIDFASVNDLRYLLVHSVRMVIINGNVVNIVAADNVAPSPSYVSIEAAIVGGSLIVSNSSDPDLHINVTAL